ncbi:MAG: ADP-ribosyltransferase domain-containing protein, partial [Pseudonocardia sp.]
EAQAEAAAARVAAGGRVDGGSLATVAAGTVQRRYLDKTPDDGYANWITDTTGRTAGGTASRSKLLRVDHLLETALAKKGSDQWHDALRALDARLQGTKYAEKRGSKTSPTFTPREAAVQRLRREIEAVLPALFPEVTDLQEVGFTKAYLEALTPGRLLKLHAAHVALGADDMVGAQRYLDELNPPVAYEQDDVKPGGGIGWADEDYRSTKLGGGAPRFDFQRQQDTMMAAQRQLLAFHAPTIGGDYATLLKYKPYKAEPLKQHERLKGISYLTDAHVRDWHGYVTKGAMKMAPLKGAVAKATDVAAEYTEASARRSEVKERPAKPARISLTRAEVTALRIYTSDEYREINAVFRDFRVDRPTANWAQYSAIAKLAVSGLGKLPKARNTVSYRGDSDVNFGGHRDVLKQGATFRLPNFYSTTTMPEKAFDGSVGYVFHNKRAGRVIEPFSAFRGEGEVLIPPGTAFRIVSEFHRQQDGTWRSADGLPLSTAPAVAEFAKQKKPRRVLLEMDEVV